MSAGDKAVLSCETDAFPEPTVAWQKDGQPLVLPERIQALLGGQRLEIQDAQVSCLEVRAALSSPGDVTPWCARGRRAAGWQDVGPASSLAQRTPVQGDEQPWGWQMRKGHQTPGVARH